MAPILFTHVNSDLYLRLSVLLYEGEGAVVSELTLHNLRNRTFPLNTAEGFFLFSILS